MDERREKEIVGDPFSTPNRHTRRRERHVATKDIGREPVAFMFWNEPDTQRHFTQIRESIGSHWANIVPLYAAFPSTTILATNTLLSDCLVILAPSCRQAEIELTRRIESHLGIKIEVAGT